jgi:hypothetical protein
MQNAGNSFGWVYELAGPVHFFFVGNISLYPVNIRGVLNFSLFLSAPG